MLFFMKETHLFFSKKKTFFPFAFSPFGPPFDREAYKVQCDLFEKKKKKCRISKILLKKYQEY